MTAHSGTWVVVRITSNVVNNYTGIKDGNSDCLVFSGMIIHSPLRQSCKEPPLYAINACVSLCPMDRSSSIHRMVIFLSAL